MIHFNGGSNRGNTEFTPNSISVGAILGLISSGDLRYNAHSYGRKLR